MTSVRVIALGSRTACDDEAALLVAERVRDRAEIVLAGRPGPGLIDLLEPGRSTVLLDAVVGIDPGEVVVVSLRELPDATLAGRPVSSHAMGPAEALRLGQALGRELPEGAFVGIGGAHWEPGRGLSPPVAQGLDAMQHALEQILDRLGSGRDD